MSAAGAASASAALRPVVVQLRRQNEEINRITGAILEDRRMLGDVVDECRKLAAASFDIGAAAATFARPPPPRAAAAGGEDEGGASEGVGVDEGARGAEGGVAADDSAAASGRVSDL